MKTRSIIQHLGTSATSIIACMVGVWFFAEPHFNEKVDERINGFIESPAMQVYVNSVVLKAQKDRDKKDSSRISFRELLSDKMELPKDEIHIELGRVYRHYKKEINEN